MFKYIGFMVIGFEQKQAAVGRMSCADNVEFWAAITDDKMNGRIGRSVEFSIQTA